MSNVIENHKIQTTHLAQQAFVYVRQSTLKQVRHNTGSTARQYDLRQRAADLGWQDTQIVVIDQDQGHSGASSANRSGFQHLVAQVSLGHAGAVFSLEASRLARSSSDWHRLLELCALSKTLVIDEEGVYDPSHYNDRLLLGFKGAMSEAELHWIRSRLQGGKLELARQGKLRFHLPTGFVHDVDNRLIKDPDQAIQAAVQQVFDYFEHCKTARAVVRYFRENQLMIPTRLWGTVRAGECLWKPLSSHRVLDMLHNPFYAGTYVYGRTQTVPYISETGKTRSKQIKRDQWQVVIPNNHEGYISWQKFQQNQEQLDDNRSSFKRSRRGTVREGVGLLQGIVLCGKCGRRMKVRYQEIRTRPTYICDAHYQNHGDHSCQAIRGHHIDEAITQLILNTMQPAHITVTLEALDQLQKQAQQVERQHQLQIERAKYEAQLAQRRFINVEPENRLVARTLELDWNKKLNILDKLQNYQMSQTNQDIQLINEEQQQHILRLVQNFPNIWSASTTTYAERKQLVRYLIKDVTLTGFETTVQIGIRWQGGAISELHIARGTLRTSTKIIEHIRKMGKQHKSDEEIAVFLNRAGFTTSRRHSFTAVRVKSLRSSYRIPRGDAQRPDYYPSGQRADGLYTVRKASELLNWGISTIHKWCKKGILESSQEAPRSPVWVKITPEIIAELRNPDNPWDTNLI